MFPASSDPSLCISWWSWNQIPGPGYSLDPLPQLSQQPSIASDVKLQVRCPAREDESRAWCPYTPVISIPGKTNPWSQPNIHAVWSSLHAGTVFSHSYPDEEGLCVQSFKQTPPSPVAGGTSWALPDLMFLFTALSNACVSTSMRTGCDQVEKKPLSTCSHLSRDLFCALWPP